MADEPVAEETKPKKKPPKLIFIAVVVLLLGGLGAVKFMGGKGKPSKPEPPKVGETLELEEFLMNLEGDHYLRMVVALGIREGVSAETLKEKTAEIRHAINMTVSGRKMGDLASAEGKEKLSADLIESVNAILTGRKPHSVKTSGSAHAGRSAVSKPVENVSAHDSNDKPPPVLEVYYSNFAMQ